eukprot:3275535-Rhodomonas_salina.1
MTDTSRAGREKRLQPSRISAGPGISGLEFDTEHQSDSLSRGDAGLAVSDTSRKTDSRRMLAGDRHAMYVVNPQPSTLDPRP